MILGIGQDLVEITRIQNSLDSHKERFLARILTEREQVYVTQQVHPAESFAGRFAAKEAAFKALGTGLRDGLSWQDVEILNNPLGKPEIFFHGKALEYLEALGHAPQVLCTISHTHTLAQALVIIQT